MTMTGNTLSSQSCRYWLLKSEPQVFSINDLQKAKKTLWDGVRNYQARNYMLNDMNRGDQILFYHSNAEPPGIAGRAEVSKKAVPDLTALDSRSPYFDPKAKSDHPIWYCVEIVFKEKFPQIIGLPTLRQVTSLKNMILLQKGSRLSVQPVTPKEFQCILSLLPIEK